MHPFFVFGVPPRVLQRLNAVVSGSRIAAFDRVARLAREFEDDARTTLIRISMERQSLLIKSTTGGAASVGSEATGDSQRLLGTASGSPDSEFPELLRL